MKMNMGVGSLLEMKKLGQRFCMRLCGRFNQHVVDLGPVSM
jgi:hypothetical protein